MTRNLFLWFLPVSVLFQYCASPGKSPLPAGEGIQVAEVCKSDSKHPYEIYLPSGSGNCGEIPLILILDPHASADFAIEHFTPIADKYKIALASSHLIRNNFSGFPNVINHILEDVSAKYPVNGDVYLAGFSGGARMALTYSQYYASKGVILAGALGSPELLANVKSPVYAIAGMADFNFIEAAQFLYRPDQTPANLLIEFIEDSHAWPETEILKNALAYLLLESLSEEHTCIDYEEEISNYLNDQLNNMQLQLDNQNYIAVYLQSQNLAHSSAFVSNEKLLSFFNSANYDDELNEQMNVLKESIRKELQSRQNYYEALNFRDGSWWTDEIMKLDKQIQHSRDTYEKFALQRIRAFLGITCYSLTKNSLSLNDLANTARLLSIYEQLEPQNSDMLYFSAVYEKKTGNIEEARLLLQKAIAAGFSDELLINNF